MKTATIQDSTVRTAPEVRIKIRALSVVDLGDGRFDIRIPGRELTREETETLSKLFPNLTDAVFRLLDREALFAVIE